MKEFEILMAAIHILKKRLEEGKILIGQDKAIRDTIRYMIEVCIEISPGSETEGK